MYLRVRKDTGARHVIKIRKRHQQPARCLWEAHKYDMMAVDFLCSFCSETGIKYMISQGKSHPVVITCQSDLGKFPLGSKDRNLQGTNRRNKSPCLSLSEITTITFLIKYSMILYFVINLGPFCKVYLPFQPLSHNTHCPLLLVKTRHRDSHHK